ncbi:hypothetical protein [Actinomadura rugatobispora]|uniref:Uncharacterized protein n=1 Tax=Actinomadura rugatobispora TaxID=1994 RepID=A0ABW1A544_9ACTN|nr:hypothetical protein GCM10010200_017270 [Actinomadura rugatobispora]
MEIHIVPDDQLADLALRLRDSSPGDWSPDALRNRGTADARFLDGELAVPVGTADPSALAQADCFRRAAQVLRKALGPASTIGSHGAPNTWGNPYLLWPQSIELRAGASGPELVLTDNWPKHQGRDGFIAHLQPDDSSPTPWKAKDWDVFERAFAAWLSTVSAEQRALGLPLVPAIHGGLLLDIYPHEDRLLIGGAGSADFPALGWIPGPLEGDDPWFDYPEWRLIGGAIGHVDGAALAATAVATARAAGVASPEDLKIMHGTQNETPEGDEYYITFHGLGINARSSR